MHSLFLWCQWGALEMIDRTTQPKLMVLLSQWLWLLLIFGSSFRSNNPHNRYNRCNGSGKFRKS